MPPSKSDGSHVKPQPKEFVESAHINSLEQYKEMYKESVENPEEFWSKIADELYWKEKWEPGKFMEYNFDPSKGAPFVKFMEGAKTNITYNCMDRFMEDRDGWDTQCEFSGLWSIKPKRHFKYMYYWEGNFWDEPTHDYMDVTWETYQIIVNKAANLLKLKGVEKGDKILMYLPITPQNTIISLAIAKIGAISVYCSGGMTAEGLAGRILDCGTELVICADGFFHGVELIKSKEIVDEAIAMCRKENFEVKLTMVCEHLSPNPGTPPPQPREMLPARRPCYFLHAPFDNDQDEWWSEEFRKMDEKYCAPVWMDAEDPLFITYTSGTTGKPKPIVHTVGGYMLYAYASFKHILDKHDTDKHATKENFRDENFPEHNYFNTLDLNHLNGITYGIYGPLLHGGNLLHFEAAGHYCMHPDPGRYWMVVGKYKAEKMLVCPSEMRLLQSHGNEYHQQWEKKSLQLLAISGEPCSPKVHRWLQNQIGENACALVDIYSSTEAGGALLTGFPGFTKQKPGLGLPYFGVVPVLLDDKGVEMEGAAEGYLCIARPWPGMCRAVFSEDDTKYSKYYFERFPGYFYTGDRARRDEEGHYYVLGHEEDMLKLEENIQAPFEIEAALETHEAIAEAAVVAFEKKNKIVPYAFVTVKWDYDFDDEMQNQLKAVVREKVGAHAVPQYIQECEEIPKNRNNSIMRRVLRLVAAGDRQAPMGDLSCLNLLATKNLDDLWNGRSDVDA